MTESKRLVTDEEAMFLRDHAEDAVVTALLDTREALMEAAGAFLSSGSWRDAKALNDLLNTLRRGAEFSDPQEAPR